MMVYQLIGAKDFTGKEDVHLPHANAVGELCARVGEKHKIYGFFVVVVVKMGAMHNICFSQIYSHKLWVVCVQGVPLYAFSLCKYFLVDADIRL